MLTKRLSECRNILPVGVVAKGGDGMVVLRKFKLKRMTGRVRIALGRPDVRDSVARRATRMIAMLLENIGPIKSPSEDIVRALAFHDREHLLWLIHTDRMEVTTIDRTVECVCGGKTDVEVSLDDLLVNILEDVDAKIDGQSRVLEFVRQKDGKKLVVRLLTGKDEEASEAAYARSHEEGELRNVHAAIVSWNNKRPSWDDLIDMKEADLEWIVAALNSLDIGSSQRIKVECTDCGEAVDDMLSPFDILPTASSAQTEVQPPYEMRSSP